MRKCSLQCKTQRSPKGKPEILENNYVHKLSLLPFFDGLALTTPTLLDLLTLSRPVLVP